MIGIILHQGILNSPLHLATVPQKMFNFDLLKQYEHLKKTLQSDIINTIVLLDSNQYTLLTHDSSDDISARNEKGYVTDSTSEVSEESTYWIDENYDCIEPQALKKGEEEEEEELDVNKTLLFNCLEFYEKKIVILRMNLHHLWNITVILRQ